MKPNPFCELKNFTLPWAIWALLIYEIEAAFDFSNIKDTGF
jgi:hypothetical protein